MPKKIPVKPLKTPTVGSYTDPKPVDPEEPLNIPEEDPDIIPDEEPPEPPPYEDPTPGEGP